MVFIQSLRKNDINPNGGKQVEFGKSFFEDFNWEGNSTNEIIIHCGTDTINTNLKVRGSERGGDREGVDCKEYANEEGKFPLKDYLINKMKFTNEHVGNVFMIFESLNSLGSAFNLYFTPFKKTRSTSAISLDVIDFPLQQIYYGAPGTGKSHEINEVTKGEDVIRTTFHPDSDYSTFVGAYKPTSTEIEMRDVTGRVIRDAQGNAVTENRIIYEFVDQAFLQAYIKAWRSYAITPAGGDPKKQYLVIEEINRGNCAQIFGDLFQLLDRNEWGFSEYPITADNDMKKQLKKAFNGLSISNADNINACYDGKDIVKEVLEGDCLLLPNNLYIWATMNTSDQSLFPIDSAFKRRWEWRYMPIDTEKEVWKISVNGTDYSWTSFLNIINEIVHEKTQSEDKQLGFFFCKAKDGVISAETFVGKVLFYLWNDVFKDYGFDDDFFKDEDLPDGTFKPLAFKSFYDVKTGKVIESQAEKFLKNLKVELADGAAPRQTTEQAEE